MIKLKPIAEHILLNEVDEKITWGDVQTLLNAVIDAQKTGGAKVAGTEIAKSSLKKVGMAGAKWAVNALTGGTAGVIIDLVASHGSDVGGFLLKLGKAVTEKELKNPKGSEFKEMTGPFWEAIKLSPEVSILLDDKIEKMFIDQVILPKLQNPGSESEELPNMDELLGAWLNDMGKLKDKADIHFKGASGDL
jgi:hypothetical protein